MAPRTTTDPLEILLEMGIDLDNLSDEEDYLSALMEATNALTIKSASDPRIPILQKEILKVRKKRKAADPTFKARKTKISANSFKKKTSSVKALPGTSKGGSLVVKKTKISAEDIKSNEDKNILESILGSVTNISDMLREQYKLEEKNAEKDRKSTEKTKRKLQESGLEKAFKGLAKTTQKVIAPVKSLLDKIFGFITTVLLARFLNKFIDWFSDPDNRSKVQSIIRFLGDHWKKLITLYLVFGTGLGRFIVGLTKTLIGGALKLGIAIAKLLAAKKLKGARGVARFLGKRGRLIKGIGTALVVGGTYAGVNSLTSSGEEKQTQGFSGGGLAKPPKVEPLPKNAERNQGMSGAQKGMAFGSLFGPLGMAAGAGIGSLFDNFGNKKDDTVKLSSPAKVELEVPSGTEGEVDGPGGIDKVPAMLTDGEFVMSRGAVQKYGVGQLEAMNASGGGTNKPKIMNNMVYAFEGGPIGDRERAPDRNLKPNSFVNRFVMGDDSLLNRLAHGDTRGVLKTLGIKIDRNTEATNRNTTQRKENNNILKDALGMGEGFVKDRIGDVKNIAPMVESFVGGLKDKRKGISEFIENTPYFGETAAIERERRLGLMKPGADSLLPEVRERLKSNDERIRNLYDPEKDTGFMGGLKNMNYELQNKGLMTDPFAALGLKEEGTEKFVEKITGGRVKNLGAKITGLQFALKGLAGPLGRAFRIDDRGSLGRYLRPAMEEAQRQGHGAVGAKALGQKKYNELVPDRLANLALGQTAFTVGEDGRAKTSDTYDSNNSAEYYFKTSREALSKGNVGPALFNGLSGLLRVNQNTGWGNLRPGGNDIDLGGGFEQTNSSGKVKKVSKMSGAQLLNAQAYAESKGKYFSSSDGKTYESYQAAVDAKKARLASNKPNVSIPAPPPKPAPKVVVANTGSGTDGSFGAGTSGKGRPSDDVNAANPGNGNKAKWSILGIPVPFT